MEDQKTTLPAVNEKNNLPEKMDVDTGRDLVKEEQKNLVKTIIDASSQKELESQLDAFNLAQSKGNALRVIKLNDLLTKVEDQAIARFNRRPDEISNKELLEYMQVVSTQIDKSQQRLIDTQTVLKPTVQVVNNKNEVNVNVGPKLNRESKEKVIDAVSNLIRSLNKQAAEVKINSDEDEDSQVIQSTDYNISNDSENK